MKRFFDILFSFIAIIFLSPIFALIALIILVFDGRPVIYKQERVGLNNELFQIWKFKTMHRDTRIAATKELTESKNQITKIGKVLRSTSIDELPQLFNVLSGKMTFVGPRPLIPAEDEIRQLRLENNVYSVRPGITGLAQVSGRDDLSIEEKVAFDREYVENACMMLDIKIMFKTVSVVLFRKNIKEGGQDEKVDNQGN